MEENKNTMSPLDDEARRHREMNKERLDKRKRILKRVAIGAVGAGAIAVVVKLIQNKAVELIETVVVGGAMGQWEEVPMQEDDIVSLTKE